MKINIEKISNQIFGILKGNSLSVKMYTEDGTHTLDPDEARRFYNKAMNIMVNFDVSSQYSTMNIGIGKSTDLGKIKGMLNQFKILANKNVIDYNVKSFGKDITPKDFIPQVVQAKNQNSAAGISEGFTRPWGTVRTTRQRFENATMYIKHRKSVDEAIQGSRSRNIAKIFIENDKHERFSFPYNSVPAARAMTVHVSEGGNPYDQGGKHILSVTEEIQKLSKFINYSKKTPELAEGKNELMTETKDRVKTLKKTINSMQSPTVYSKYMESIDLDAHDDTVTNDELFEGIPVSEVADALPYLTKINERCQANKSRRKLVAEIAKIIVDAGCVNVMEQEDSDLDGIAYADPDHVIMEWLGYYAEFSESEDLKSKLHQVMEEFKDFPANLQETMTNVLTSMKNSTKIVKQADTADNTVDAACDSIESELAKF